MNNNLIKSAHEFVSSEGTAKEPQSYFKESRWVKMPAVPLSTKTQQIFQSLATEAKSLKGAKDSEALDWTVAKTIALFQAMNNSLITTPNDIAETTQLETEIARIKASPELKATDAKCLSLVNEALEEIKVLQLAIRLTAETIDRLENTANLLADVTNSPLYPEEALLHAQLILDGITLLQDLSKKIDTLPPNSGAKERLKHTLSLETKRLEQSIENWNGEAIQIFNQEFHSLQEELKSPKSNQSEICQQLTALKRQQESICSILYAAKDWESAQLTAEILEDIGKDLENLSKTLPSASSQMDYGSEAWQALAAKRSRQQPQSLGFLQKLFMPETWNESTQEKVKTFLGLIQISQQAISIYQQIEQAKTLEAKAEVMSKLEAEQQKQVPSERVEEIVRGGALLGNILTDKYEVLHKNPSLAKTLTKTLPDVESALHDALHLFRDTPPTREQISAFQQAYESRHIHANMPSPFAHISLSEWWNLFTKAEYKGTSREYNVLNAVVPFQAPEYTVVTSEASWQIPWAQKLISNVTSLFAEPSKTPSILVMEKRDDGLQQIQDVLEHLEIMEENLTQDFSSATEGLKSQITLMQSELLKTAKQAPSATCSLVDLAAWTQEVSDKCYAVERLETQIQALMEKAKQTLSSSDAELARFGKKHENLVKMARLVESLQIPGVVVPLPQGITSDRVTSYLQGHAPIVFENWKALGAMYEAYEGDQPFLEDLKVKGTLQAINAAVIEAFAKAGDDDRLFEQLATKDFVGWLDSVDRNGDYLMVRSTGSEDSRETANAGGNVSEAYVRPTRQEFSAAAAEVVTSYFGFSSLQNLINAKVNPFDQELKLAVTAQQLIGEPVGGTKNAKEIPISLVLFTNEPLYVGTEKFRVMRLSTTYGHGEGVVGGVGIASDTTLLLISEAHPDQIYIQYSNTHKPTRLAPVRNAEGKIELVPLKNPGNLQMRQALNPELLMRLYTLGIVMEKYFEDTATDMEIVIKNGIIYPVQARPVNRQTMLPTYVDIRKASLQQHSPIIESLRAEVMVPGKASVIMITDPKQVDATISLKEAEEKYLTKVHKVVIVNNPEPANSHPVVNFSGLGVTCLQVSAKDKEKMDRLIRAANPNGPLLIDSQTGEVYAWDGTKGSAEDYIVSGYAVHPAKIAPSLATAKELKPSTSPSGVPQEVKELLIAIRSAVTDTVAKEKLQELRHHPFVTSLMEQKERLDQHNFVPQTVKEISSTLAVLDSEISAIFEEVEAVLNVNAQPEEKRLRTLLPIKTLETLLIDKPSSEGTLGRYSRLSVEPLYQDALELVEYQKKFEHPVHFADIYLAANTAIDPTSKQAWQRYLEDLEAKVQANTVTQEQVSELKSMIQTLSMTGMLPPWFAFYFKPNQTLLPSSSETGVLARIVSFFKGDEYLEIPTVMDKEKIAFAVSIGKEVNSLRDQLATFAEPNSAMARSKLKKLVHKMTQTSGPESIKEMLTNAHPVTRLMLLSTMQELVDLYDHAIKEMKGTPEHILSTQDKIIIFTEMLTPYFSLLTIWAEQLNDLITLPAHNRWPLASYLEAMHRTFQEARGSLQPSEEFNVSHSIYGAVTEFSRGAPKTLEDFFTLVHQNLINIISHVNEKSLSEQLIKDSILPEIFKNTLQSINVIRSKYERRKTGIEVLGSSIAVKYNIPLRNHSAQLILKYDKPSQKTTLITSFLGEERDRWDKMTILTSLKNLEGKAILAEPIKRNSFEVTIPWSIDRSTSVEEILKFFDIFCDYSLERTQRAIYELVFHHFWRELDLNSISLNSGLIDLIQNNPLLDKTIIHTIFSIENYDNIVRNVVEKIISEPTLVNFQLLQKIDLSENFQSKLIDFSQTLWAGDEVARLNSLSLLKILYFKQPSIGIPYDRLRAGLDDPSKNVRRQSLDLIIELLKNNPRTDFVLTAFCVEAAFKGISDSNLSIRRVSFELPRILILNNHFYDFAIQFALFGIQLSDQSIHAEILDLLHQLVIRDQGYDVSIKVAKTHIKDPTLKSEVTRLIKGLIGKDLGYDLAIQFIETWMNEPKVLMNVYELSNELIENDKAFDLALKAAEIGIRMGNDQHVPENDPIIAQAHDLLNKVVDIKQGRQGAIKAAESGILDENDKVRKAALESFKKLFVKGLGFEEAIAAARIGIAHTNRSIREFSLKLLVELIKNNQADDSVVKDAAKMGFEHETSRESFILFDYLFNKGAGFDVALNIAQNGLAYGDDYIRLCSLRLFNKLIQNNQAFDESLKAAAIGFLDNDEHIVNDSIALFKDLFSKGLGLKEAIRAAEIGMSHIRSLQNRKSLELLTEVIETRQDFDASQYDAIIKVIELGLGHVLFNIRDSSMTLFIKLLHQDKDGHFQEKSGEFLLKAAEHSLKTYYFAHLEISLKLFIELVKKGFCIEHAKKAVLIGIKDVITEPIARELERLLQEIPS